MRASSSVPFVSCLLSLVGQQAGLFSFGHRQFSGLAPKGAALRASSSLSLTGRELCSLPDPPSNRRSKAAPPLVVLAGFTFGQDARRQFSRLAS